MKLKKLRAGCLPFWLENDVVHVALMVPSSSAYGGTAPQLAKGRVGDPKEKPFNEDPLDAALREGQEEVGLDPGAVQTILSPVEAVVQGDTGKYPLRVWAVAIPGPEALGKPGYETGAVVRLTLDEAAETIRDSQRTLFARLAAGIRTHVTAKES